MKTRVFQHPRSSLSALLPGAVWLALFALSVSAFGQEADGDRRIFKREPFDRITLTPAFKSEVIEVEPIDHFPNRRVPTTHKPGEKLRVHWYDVEASKVVPQEIAWSSIDKVELFEQLVLEEANKLVSEGKLDEAFDYFSFQVASRV